MRLPVLAAGVAMALLVACSAGPDQGRRVGHEPTPTQPTGSTSPLPSPTPPTPSPSIQVYALGDVVKSAAGSTVAAYSWDTDVRRPVEPDDPGYRWSEALIKFCVGPGTGALDVASSAASYFSLEFKDGTRIAADSSGYNSRELQSRSWWACRRSGSERSKLRPEPSAEPCDGAE